jgi:hypothetical protein
MLGMQVHRPSFSKGEVIWAKIKGYPWWPAVVSTILHDDSDEEPRAFIVKFIGENSHAKLPDEKIARFNEKLEEYSNRKNKKLVESIDVALKILRSETTFEAEWKKNELRVQALNSPQRPVKEETKKPSMQPSPKEKRR